MKLLKIFSITFVLAIGASILFFSCAENPTGPSATATPVPQPTSTPVPTQAPTTDVTPQATSTPNSTPQATSTPQSTNTPVATITPVPRPLTFTQTFEEDNGTFGLYFLESTSSIAAMVSSEQYDGAYSLETLFNGSTSPGGYVTVFPQEGAPVNIQNLAAITLHVYDPDNDAGRFIGIQLVDQNNATSSIIYSAVPTVTNTWVALSFPLSSFSVDLSNLVSVRIYSQENDTFYFDGINSN